MRGFQLMNSIELLLLFFFFGGGGDKIGAFIKHHNLRDWSVFQWIAAGFVTLAANLRKTFARFENIKKKTRNENVNQHENDYHYCCCDLYVKSECKQQQQQQQQSNVSNNVCTHFFFFTHTHSFASFHSTMQCNAIKIVKLQMKIN